MKQIPLFRFVAEPLEEAAKNVKPFQWAPEDLGKRHRLGGTPDFIQSEDWPRCPSCSEQMSFYAQLDAIGPEYAIGDSGLIYVFFCFGCNETLSLVHSY